MMTVKASGRAAWLVAAAGLFLLAAPRRAHAADVEEWPNYGHDLQRTQRLTNRLSPPLTLRWHAKTSGAAEKQLLGVSGLAAARNKLAWAGDVNLVTAGGSPTYICDAYSGLNRRLVMQMMTGGAAAPSFHGELVSGYNMADVTRGRLRDIYGSFAFEVFHLFEINVGDTGDMPVHNGLVYWGETAQSLDDGARKFSFPWMTADVSGGGNGMYSATVRGFTFGAETESVLYAFWGDLPMMLTAFDTESGTTRWQRSGSAGKPSAEAGYIYFSDRNNDYKLTAAGAVVWQKPRTSWSLYRAPALAADVVIHHEEAGGGGLVARAKDTGEQRWQFSGHNPVIAGDVVYAIQAGGKNLCALDLATGQLLATLAHDDAPYAPHAGIFEQLIVGNGMLYAVVRLNDHSIPQLGSRWIEAFTGLEPIPRVNSDETALHVRAGEPLVLTAESSLVAPERTLASCSWDLGDGTVLDGPSVTHTYAASTEYREYEVSLQVTDSAGESVSRRIKVEVAPSAEAPALATSSEELTYELVATPGGELALFYTQGANVLMRSSGDGGATWSEAATVFAGTGAHSHPKAFVDEATSDIYLTTTEKGAVWGPQRFWLHELAYQGSQSWQTASSRQVVSSSDLGTYYGNHDGKPKDGGSALRDAGGRWWLIYAVNDRTYYSASDDGAATWSASAYLCEAQGGSLYATLWHGKPVVFSARWDGSGEPGYGMSFWNGSAFSGRRLTDGRSVLPGRDALVVPGSQELHAVYKVWGQISHQTKDAAERADNWVMASRKVTPTHAALPDDGYPFLSSDGQRTYLLYGEWVRSSPEGHRYHVALRSYDPASGWQADATYVARDAGVNLKPMTVKNAAGLGYLPVVWQEKAAGQYRLKYAAVPVDSACGNGVLDGGELCDGNCPTGCPDDGDACTSESLTGAGCSSQCITTLVTTCGSGDGCCPAGCDAASDGDCSASCGDGILDGGEMCDPPATCPSSCDDADPCTDDFLTGSAATCNVACSHAAVTACAMGDGCCPSGCTDSADDDCAGAPNRDEPAGDEPAGGEPAGVRVTAGGCACAGLGGVPWSLLCLIASLRPRGRRRSGVEPAGGATAPGAARRRRSFARSRR